MLLKCLFLSIVLKCLLLKIKETFSRLADLEYDIFYVECTSKSLQHPILIDFCQDQSILFYFISPSENQTMCA